MGSKVFNNSPRVLTSKLKACIEYWVKYNTKNRSKCLRTIFLAKYGCLDIYDEELNNIFIINHVEIQYDKVMAGL